VSGGLHGVGSCVNALSKMLRLTMRRDGKVHTMEFSKGFVQNRIVETVGGVEVSPMKVMETDNEGTEVSAGHRHFRENNNSLRDPGKRLRELSFLNNGVNPAEGRAFGQGGRLAGADGVKARGIQQGQNRSALTFCGHG
jgi:DNA gyrase subunit B